MKVYIGISLFLLTGILVFNPSACFAQTDVGTITLVTVGDSTVANYAESDSKRGWGQELPAFFNSNIKIINLAKSGKSTKTFRKTPNWNQALQEKPDFIFIQFGHNDSHGPKKPESTVANGDFIENLRQYIAEAKAINITPILVTPMHRRRFTEGGALTQELKPYADAMKQAGKETGVTVIDLYRLSGDLFTKLGESGTEDLFDTNDRTHFSAKGAKAMASLIASECAKTVPRLAKNLNSASSN